MNSDAIKAGAFIAPVMPDVTWPWLNTRTLRGTDARTSESQRGEVLPQVNGDVGSKTI